MKREVFSGLFGFQDTMKGIIGLAIFLVALLAMIWVYRVYTKRARFLANEIYHRTMRGTMSVPHALSREQVMVSKSSTISDRARQLTENARRFYKGDRLAPLLMIAELVLGILQIVGFAIMVW